jgi:hypothetical protein
MAALNYIYNLHQLMVTNKIILVYEGEFTQEITKSVLAMAERNMESTGEEETIKRKVFNVMVECLQNICKHSDENPEIYNDNEGAIFMIGNDKNAYTIISGNPILNENIGTLKERLEQINSLDKDGLKSLYKEIITTGNLSEKGGAGLGFVDMARKSGNKLEFSFDAIDGNHSFFSLRTVINKERN